MSSSSTNLFRKAKDLNTSPKFAPYTGVRILTGLQDDDKNDIVYESGDMNGRVLEISNEWGTQAQADNICAQITGWAYQPFNASTAIIDPAAELNDGVTVNGVYSGICKKVTRFGRLMASDIEAPNDEEINHEYSYKASTDRKYTRQLKETKAELKIQASQIAAKVSSSGGKASSFGWVLTDTDWSLYSNGNLVLRADDSGLTVAGTIKAGDFMTLSGQTLATKAELEAIQAFSAGGYGGGFMGVMAAADAFNLAALSTGSNPIDRLFIRKLVVSGTGGIGITSALRVTSAGIDELYVKNPFSNYQQAQWTSKTPTFNPVTVTRKFRIVNSQGVETTEELTVLTGGSCGSIVVLG